MDCLHIYMGSARFEFVRLPKLSGQLVDHSLEATANVDQWHDNIRFIRLYMCSSTGNTDIYVWHLLYIMACLHTVAHTGPATYIAASIRSFAQNAVHGHACMLGGSTPSQTLADAILLCILPTTSYQHTLHSNAGEHDG